jgi:hypothetical protein
MPTQAFSGFDLQIPDNNFAVVLSRWKSLTGTKAIPTFTVRSTGMSNSKNTESERVRSEVIARRRFLKHVATTAVTVPAAALLLSAASKPSLAASPYGKSGNAHGKGGNRGGTGGTGGNGRRNGNAGKNRSRQ